MMKKSLLNLGFLSLLLTQCGRLDRKPTLATRVWQELVQAEAKSSFIEVLDPATQSQHDKNMAAIEDRLPSAYPQPYLPLGRLSNSRIDPPLARMPFLDADIIELGELLFFDERLSFSKDRGFPGGISCASCHQPDLFFTDGRAHSLGVDGDRTTRNSPSLFNAAFHSTLTWANPIFPILEMQARIPLFGDDPIEMGLRGREHEVLDKLLEQDSTYQKLFRKVFGLRYPEDLHASLMDYNHITAALAAYERSLIAFDTKFDRFLQGKAELHETESEGVQLFYGMRPLASGETLSCSRCHSGFLLTNSFHYVREARYYNQQSFHNTGLYNLDGKGAYPLKNQGFASSAQLAENPALMGQFRVPSLRFVAFTAPYGHDGSLPTLEAVIEHYAAGGRASLSEKGQNPWVDPLIKPGFSIRPDETKALLSFLQTLSRP